MPRTATIEEEGRVMSEPLMMKSYYYPSSDNPNSINGTLVIDFNLDKKQKMAQKGGSPFVTVSCSNEDTRDLNLVPLETFSSIFDVLYLSSTIEYTHTVRNNFIAAAAAADAAAAAAKVAATAAAFGAAFDAAVTNDANRFCDDAVNAIAGIPNAARNPVAAGTVGAAAFDAALALALDAAIGVVAAANNAAAAAVIRYLNDEGYVNAYIFEFLQMRLVDLVAAYNAIAAATIRMDKANIQLGESISGSLRFPNKPRFTVVQEANFIRRANALNVTSTIWTTFTNNIVNHIERYTSNKIISLICNKNDVMIFFNEIPSNPNPAVGASIVSLSNGNWRIFGQTLQSDLFHATIHEPKYTNRVLGAPKVLSSGVPSVPNVQIPGALHVQRPDTTYKYAVGSKWQLCTTYDCADGPNWLPANIKYDLISPSQMVYEVSASPLQPDPIVIFFERFMKIFTDNFIQVSKSFSNDTINNATLDHVLRQSLLVESMRPLNLYNRTKDCLIAGAGVAGVAGVAGAGRWNNFFTTATIGLNDLCLVSDNSSPSLTEYAAWVSSTNPLITREPTQANDNLYPIVIAETSANVHNAVLVKIPSQTDIRDLFTVPKWVAVGALCMSLRINQDNDAYLPGRNYAKIVDIPNPNNARMVRVEIYGGLPETQMVSIYAIRECNAAEAAEARAASKAAAPKAAAPKASASASAKAYPKANRP